MLGKYKIRVYNKSESKEAQDLFEQLGFMWAGDHPENGDWYSHLYAENSTCCYLSPYVWEVFVDYCYYDCVCVRLKADRDFNSNTSFHFDTQQQADQFEIGRASCRERVSSPV